MRLAVILRGISFRAGSAFDLTLLSGDDLLRGGPSLRGCARRRVRLGHLDCALVVPQAVWNASIWAISGSCASWMRAVSCVTSAPTAWSAASRAMATACWWWGILCWAKVMSAALWVAGTAGEHTEYGLWFIGDASDRDPTSRHRRRGLSSACMGTGAATTEGAAAVSARPNRLRHAPIYCTSIVAIMPRSSWSRMLQW